MKRTSVLFLLLPILILMLAGSAQATRWDAFEADADCTGWTVDGAAKVGSANQPYVEIPYEITLSQDGMVLEEFAGSVRAYFQMDADEFSLSGTFTTEMQGAYEVAGVFTLPHVTEGESVQSFTIALECGDAPPGCDPHRPNWWMNHCHAWPVDQLQIGGCTYSEGQLKWLMRRCTRHLVSKRLLRHLVAAKLNAANGCAEAPEDVIAAADAFFAEHGLNGRLSRPERREARDLKRLLRAFNLGLAGGNKSGAAIEDSITDVEDEIMNMTDLKASFR